MRFYVSTQSQMMVAAGLSIAALLALAFLLIFAWRVLGEVLERSQLADSEMLCRSCKAKAVHPSFQAGIVDHLLALFSCVPYRCHICSWRFYVYRPGASSHSASQVP